MECRLIMSSRVTLTDSLHYLCCVRSLKNVQENFYDHLVCCWLLAAISQDDSSPVCLLSYEVTHKATYMLLPLFFFTDKHISYRRKLGSPLGCCLDQQSLTLTREKKQVSISERWIQSFRGHLRMSAGPLPSAVHS